MGYTWTDGELITATKLNNTGGSGVLICNSSMSNGVYVLDKTAQEIYDALLAGTPAYIKYQYGTFEGYSGNLYLAPVIKVYNYDDTNIIRICASKPEFIGSKGTFSSTFSPAVLIYQASDADDYPTFYTTIYITGTNVNAGISVE